MFLFLIFEVCNSGKEVTISRGIENNSGLFAPNDGVLQQAQ
jgi:hypothetical protein